MMTEAQFQHMRRAHKMLESWHPGYEVTGWNPSVTMDLIDHHKRVPGTLYRPSDKEIADAMAATR